MSNNESVPRLQDLIDAVEDVQATNKSMLGRLTDLAASNEQSCTCACHNPDSSQKVSQKLHDLEERIKTIEAIVKGGSSNVGAGCTSGNHRDSRSIKPGELRPMQVGKINLVTDVKPCELIENNTKGPKPREIFCQVEPTEETPTKPNKEAKETRLENANIKNAIQASSINVPLQDGVKERQTELDSGRMERSPKNFIEETSRRYQSDDKTRDKLVPKSKANPRAEMEYNAASRPTYEDVEVIRQTETRIHAKGSDWVDLAQIEIQSGKCTELRTLEGAHTAILLDISESMAGDAWYQARAFLDDFLNGLSDVSREHELTNEHVSLVTFGHETRVVCRLTKNYDRIRQAVGSLRLGGPSPLFGGLYMALSSILHSKDWDATVNDLRVHSKIVVITDGHITDTLQYQGPDITDDKQEEYVKHLEVSMMDIIRKDIDVYTVPVGNKEKRVMDILGKAHGHNWSWKEGKKLSRRGLLTVLAGPGIHFGLMGVTFDPNFGSDVPLTDSDRLQMIDIVSEAKRRAHDEWFRRWSGEEDPYLDTGSPQLLAVGTRVKRGPDWDISRDEDCNGPGTVVGHLRYQNKVWVKWDNDDQWSYKYRCGEDSCYDVLPCLDDEIRRPSPDGRLKVGCRVKPGKNAKDSHPELKPFDRGVVVALRDNKIRVKWDNGTKGDYDYIPGVREEVEYSTPGDANVTVKIPEEKQPQERKNKNKN